MALQGNASSLMIGGQGSSRRALAAISNNGIDGSRRLISSQHKRGGMMQFGRSKNVSILCPRTRRHCAVQKRCPRLSAINKGDSSLEETTGGREEEEPDASKEDSEAKSSGGNGGGKEEPGFLQRAAAFVDAQYLPIGLLTTGCLATIFPGPGIACDAAGVGKLCTFGIFVLSGMSLKQNDARSALSATGALSFGLATILGFTALIAPLCLNLPIEPHGLRVGLAIFCCAPTTLSSGIAMTQAVGGNTAMALLLTVMSNIAGIFTMPFMLKWALGSAVAIDPVPLLQSLVQTIMIPLLLGASARRLLPPVSSFIDSNKAVISKLQSTLLIGVPWMQVSKSVSAFANIQASSLLAVAMAGLAVHATYLAFNSAAVRRVASLGAGPAAGTEEAVGIERAVIIVGSQKTLPVAVAVISSMGASLGPIAGLAVIPCIICHLMQIIADSFLVSYWLKRSRTSAAGAPA